jgi:hypothetical protein
MLSVSEGVTGMRAVMNPPPPPSPPAYFLPPPPPPPPAPQIFTPTQYTPDGTTQVSLEVNIAYMGDVEVVVDSVENDVDVVESVEVVE